MASDMKNTISGAWQAESASIPGGISNRRLWFEFSASVASWLSLGLLDSVIAWRACVHQEQFGNPSPHPGARILFLALWCVLFGLAALAGSMSYRTWRTLSGAANLLNAEGRERQEFMSLSGLFISITLGIGFLWMCLPLFMLQMCGRTR